MAIFIRGNTFSTKTYPVYLNGKNLLSFQTKNKSFQNIQSIKSFHQKKKKRKETNI